MAPASKTNKNLKMQELEDIDAFCFVCRGVLIKPVTLPCKHVFCFDCFQDSMTETSYSCPLCRKRISNWARRAKKGDNLVNKQLWEVIQHQFKNEVSSKLSGEDDGLDERIQEHFKSQPKISPDGEVGSEYMRQIKEYEEELRRHREEEERASLELIKKIADQDKEEREKCRLEARLLNEQNARIKHSPKPSSKNVASTSKRTPPTERKVTHGPMDKHIKRIFSQHRADLDDSSRSESSGSGDSISSELNHFKPIRIVPKTPPKDGTARGSTLKKIVPRKILSRELTSTAVNAVKIDSFHSQFSAFKCATAVKVSSCETPSKKPKLISEPIESGILKEINLEENSDSNSRSELDGKTQEDIRIPNSLFGEENLSQLREEHLRLEKRLEQEKADRELALKLSRDWEAANEPRAHRLPRSCRSSARQTTLLDSVIRRRRK